MRKLNLLISLFLFSTLLFSQEEAYKKGKISPYTAHFISSYRNASNDSLQQKSLQKRFGIQSSQPQQQTHIDAFIELNENASLETLQAQGVEINMVLPDINIITSRIPAEKIEHISLLPEVKRVEIGIPVQKKMDKARPASFVDEVQTGSNLSKAYTGKNVVIGIIDGGFQYSHTNFYSSDKSELRIKRVWNQNEISEMYPNGRKYETEQEIKTLNYDTKKETHGTHVAGIAAGADNTNGNPYYGIAPEADLVFVSYDTNDNVITNVSISNGIQYIYDYAKSVNKPAVVNMSLGVHIGPHDGTSTFDKICDNLQGAGKLLVGATGNEGSDKLHISKTFSPTDDLLQTFISFKKEKEEYNGWADIWSEENKSFSAQLIIYDQNTGEETAITEVFESSIDKYQKYPVNKITGGGSDSITVYALRDSGNKRSNVLIITDISRNFPPNQHLGLKITAKEGTVHAWADNSDSHFLGHGVSGWTTGDGNNSVSEIGGTGKRIISVGAYVTRAADIEVLNNIASFSSTGPTLDGRMKPDITAPGSVIYSSYSDAVKHNIVRIDTIDNNLYYYGKMQGTSMAAPHVSGVLATWLEAKNDLTPEEVRFVLKKTAINDSLTTNGTVPEGNNTWGYGKINAYAGINECLRLAKDADYINKYGDIIINHVDMQSRSMSLQCYNNVENVKMYIYNINGQLVYTEQIQNNFIGEKTIDLSQIGGGVLLIKFKGENLNSKTQKIILP